MVETGSYVRFVPWTEPPSSISPDASDDELIEWFTNRFGDLEEGKLLTRPGRTEIAGYPAVTAERESFLLGKSIVTVVVTGEKVLIFDCFYSVNNRGKAAEIFKSMLSTLQINSQ